MALGILAAGLAFALQEVIGSIAGWVTIVTGRPFAIGDRIETGGIRGDVVDISVLRTTLMEIGNWLGGDHNTGRIVTVSNAFIFKEPLFNYSRHLHYVWDEIEVPITYESDWQQAIADHDRCCAAASALPGAAAPGARAAPPGAAPVRHQDHAAGSPGVRATDRQLDRAGPGLPGGYRLRGAPFAARSASASSADFAAAGIVIASQTVAIVQFPGTAEQAGVQAFMTPQIATVALGRKRTSVRDFFQVRLGV